MYNIYNVAGLLAWWSHSITFRGCAIGSLGGSWSKFPDGQSVALSEDVVWNSLCLFTAPCNGLSSLDLVGVSNHLLRALNWALLAVWGSQSDSSELPLVTPLTFSDLALSHLGGTLLILGGSSVEVLLIWILHWSLFAANVLCWLSKLLVTALPCWSLTVWMASCIVLWIIVISGVGKYSVLVVRLPDSSDDDLEVSLLLDSLFAL